MVTPSAIVPNLDERCAANKLREGCHHGASAKFVLFRQCWNFYRLRARYIEHDRDAGTESTVQLAGSIHSHSGASSYEFEQPDLEPSNHLLC